jgi:hypothetical protein
MEKLARNGLVLAFAVALASSLSGCRLVEGVFKAGFWSAIVIALAVFALAWGAMRVFRGRGTAP